MVQDGAVPSPEPGCDAHAVLNAQINWQRFLAANSPAATDGFPLVLEVSDDYTFGMPLIDGPHVRVSCDAISTTSTEWNLQWLSLQYS